jgi:hypothetical protein
VFRWGSLPSPQVVSEWREEKHFGKNERLFAQAVREKSAEIGVLFSFHPFYMKGHRQVSTVDQTSRRTKGSVIVYGLANISHPDGLSTILYLPA